MNNAYNAQVEIPENKMNSLADSLGRLENGLVVAIIIIFLMLAAKFQSLKVSAVVLATVPAVILGSLSLFIGTESTLNLQSYMGIIMSVGMIPMASGIGEAGDQ
ncbi:MAG TPA: hypothetical protein VHE34_17110 [Puia sp.]|uniref:hypothetical protein n=1 Tax=Puia sp. TaxID=2045100 RepID=UPI002B6BF46F|nr:hypothetical protein [Puia sp.]HVU96954.1 hypothetical protein [Puia sp.]